MTPAPFILEIEPFPYKCFDRRCAGETQPHGNVAAWKGTLPDGRRVVFDSRADVDQWAADNNATVREKA